LAVVLSVSAQSKQKIDKKQTAAQVKRELLHACNDHKKYACGHDDLQPLSKIQKDWYGQTLLMIPVDSLDRLILLDFD
jgi:ER degradation enhancer, mannosidase alpha-like 2